MVNGDSWVISWEMDMNGTLKYFEWLQDPAQPLMVETL